MNNLPDIETGPNHIPGWEFFGPGEDKPMSEQNVNQQALAVVEPLPRKRGFLKRQMRNALLFLPNLVKLSYRLIRDARVSKTEKMILAGVIAYVVMPLDFIPDLIPFIGEVDDTYLVAIALLRMFNSAGPGVIREHWDGEGDIYGFLTRISMLSTFFLPKRIRRALVGRIELPDNVVDIATRAARGK